MLTETFLQTLRDVRATGANVPETSFYPALAELFNGIGKQLAPKVSCVINLKNRGAGIPDGGFFTADQLRRRPSDDATLFAAQPPARGALEVKPPEDDLEKVLASEQVQRYFEKYGAVLVTNLRAFALVGRNAAGQPAQLETFTLAETEADFWQLAAHPRAAAAKLGERFAEYLHRVLLHNAPLVAPQDLAALLASYARDAKARIEHVELPALAGVREALEQALGLKFEGEKGEHFFRSTLVQTLFYGLFSAWVLWARQGKTPPPFKQALREASASYGDDPKTFHWQSAAWRLRVPMIRALFEQFATPAKLGKLGLVEVLDWTAAALNRVDRAAFFAAFDAEHAVQYFYEPFLEAFDPELRKELGVWFTPPEIVDYQVERVDTVLREELDIPDGLADPRVVVLDPCCGTATYVRAVLRRIARTLHDKGGDALVAQDLKRAALERVFGFEILPAPFVVAHLQLSLLLETLGAPLEAEERVGVYLTNALTGWEPPKDPKQKLLFQEFEEERDAANKVKQTKPILVILGNPPYNGFAGVAVEEERDLSNAYRNVKKVAAPQGQGLNDLLVRFFRMAERRIVEMNKPAAGVISYISNYAWLDGLSFTGMRERYLEAFDSITIDCLNGDKYKTGKLTPEGKPDPSVFSTEFNREGIQVGTAITTLVKVGTAGPAVRGALGERALPMIRFRHFWGKTKRADLLAAKDESFQSVTPILKMGLSFMPATSQPAYFVWPQLTELFPSNFPGVKTSRDNFLVDIDRARLEERVRKYFDPKISHDEIRRSWPDIMEVTSIYDAEKVRENLRKRGLKEDRLADSSKKEITIKYCYRPFDLRWLYWEPETNLVDRKREEYLPHVFPDNIWLSAGQRNRKEDFYQPQFTRQLADHHIVESNVAMFPLWLRDPLRKENVPNLGHLAETYLKQTDATPEDLFFHTLAILHAPKYRAENAGALRQDWPRIPLPGWAVVGRVTDPAQVNVDAASVRISEKLLEVASTKAAASETPTTAARKLLENSAALGRQVAALLDTETPVAGVTAGKIREDLKSVAVFSRLGGKAANPAAGDLDLTAGWGHAGQGGVTMPGKGKTVVQGDALDIYLNDATCWRNVPRAVWDYTIGGYQVIKKWLSYREKALLGRGLTIDEVRYVTEMARRLAALLALQDQLDANYCACKKLASSS